MVKTKGQIAFEEFRKIYKAANPRFWPNFDDGLQDYERAAWEAATAAVQPQIDGAMVDRALRAYYGKINDHCITCNEAMRAVLKSALEIT